MMEIKFVSKTHFKVIGFKDFEDHTYLLERHKSYVFKHKDKEVYRMRFRSSNHEKYWIERGLYCHSEQNRARFYDEERAKAGYYYKSGIDILALDKECDEYIKNLESNG